NASRRGVRAMALSLLSGMIMMANPVTAANLPTGGQIVAGSGSIQTPSGNQMNIIQNSQNMVANWNSFDIGKGNTVQFYQPNSSAVALNRVVGGGESKIMGNLKANGQVFLVNPNGVLFGKDASVSTSGFVASTRDIKNDDFMNRRYTFSGGQKAGAEIVNQGALTTNAGGYIVLAADKVSNSGTIRTPGGKTVLAAGERVTLQLDNGGLTSVQVSGDVVNALVENRGLISARDGQVYLTAFGRDMLMNTVLNVSGVVEAGGMHRQDGNIVLDGGDSGVVHLSGTLQADNASGQGGKVVVQGQNILLDKGSSITATGSQGGGEVYIGGGWQGKDSSIRNADKVVMQDGARIDVSATQQGNGGTAVLWSESFTNFRGQISAKGGENGGNGGQVETSSHGNLQAFGSVSASAKKGKAGNWLLDPLDITIVNGADNAVTETNDTLSQPPHTQFTPTATGSQVSNTSINDELNNGTSVTVLTSSTTAGGNQNGNITVDADINKTNGTDATLTLLADGNITVNKNITSTAGKLNVNLAAANTSSTGTITLGNNVNITTNGGDITAGTANASNSVTINVTGTNTVLNTTDSSNGNQAGNITLNGSRVNVTNATITAGNFTLNATANGADLNGVTLMAAHDINLTGNSTNGTGLQLNGNTTLNATNGSISLTGNSTNGTGLFLGGNKTLSASNGNINLTGNSQTGVGLYLGERNSTNAFTATNGSINLNGVSVAKSAIEIRGNNTLTADNINLTGNSTKSFGIDAQDGANTLNATNGSINLTGNSTNGTGLQLNNGTNTLNATNGSINLTGNSTNGTGLQLSNGTNTLNATNGSINLTGNSTNGTGLQLNGTNTLNATNGSISLTGNSTNGTGLFLGGNKTLSASNGNINLTGSSTKGVGLYLGERNSTNAFTATNGSINLNGVSEATNAIEIRGNNTLTADNINLTGNSTNGTGIDLQGTNTLTATSGNISLNGTAQSRWDGVRIQGRSNITATNGSISLTGHSDANIGVSLSGSSSWDATNITITGSSSWNGSTASEDVYVGRGIQLDGNLTFTGNVAINGTGEGGSGVALRTLVNLTFNNGTAVINGTSTGHSVNDIYTAGIGLHSYEGETDITNIILNNSNLTMNGHSQNAAGIGGWSDSDTKTKWNISGNGNVTINGSSVEMDGFRTISINATGLNGSVALFGKSTNGSGVKITKTEMSNV
ncbi:TPA: filamentous hemagglutinin N-terminal domain-containing protein, partial [Escherichia coli]|nr:filamentous hemagglutinin N-terminal domain-containing protein [Escherichia coli]HDS0167349.1 filamentous hemagglutinin N-terminal domain-containing protein [Escherichia coli]